MSQNFLFFTFKVGGSLTAKSSGTALKSVWNKRSSGAFSKIDLLQILRYPLPLIPILTEPLLKEWAPIAPPAAIIVWPATVSKMSSEVAFPLAIFSTCFTRPLDSPDTTESVKSQAPLAATAKLAPHAAAPGPQAAPAGKSHSNRKLWKLLT